ncbi:MAG: DNA invertase Pin-like site-specific DNA recombinase [Gammaproteobacteria bacterium]|jgi:DNA invertase Pin-like site-specific DNA recombinase
MVTNKIKELQALQAKAATLQAAIDVERNAELASLPSKYGFDTTAAFIQAVRNADGAKTNRKGKATKKTVVAKSTAKGSAVVAKRTRAKITPAIKAKVKSAVKAGTSGAMIAKSLGISLPSVHNIKKELGLVKARGVKERKAK